MGSNGEGQTHIHTAAVTFDWGIQKLFDLGESDNFIEFPPDFCPLHSQNRAVQKDVFTASKFGMKACPDFQQTRYAATNADATLRRLGNAAEDFQQSRFP